MTSRAARSKRTSVPGSFLLLAGLLAALPPGALAQGSAAAPPAALVLDVSGPVSPPVLRHSEIPAQTSLALGTSGRITFVHYGMCRVVTVAGGTVRVLPARFEVEAGRIEADRQRPCPRQQKLPITGQAGALVTRGITAPRPAEPALTTLAPQPTIVLVGPGAPRIREGRCTQRATQDQVALTVADSVATPATPLAPGDYTCDLTTGDGRGRARLSFQVVADPAAPDLFVATVD